MAVILDLVLNCQKKSVIWQWMIKFVYLQLWYPTLFVDTASLNKLSKLISQPIILWKFFFIRGKKGRRLNWEPLSPPSLDLAVCIIWIIKLEKSKFAGIWNLKKIILTCRFLIAKLLYSSKYSSVTVSFVLGKTWLSRLLLKIHWIFCLKILYTKEDPENNSFVPSVCL